MAPPAIAQVSSGLILGLSSVIYAVSYAALMFSGPLAPHVNYGIAICLVTAAIGGLYGRFSEEPTFVSGPESNTSSVLAGILGAAATASVGNALNQTLVVLVAASLFTGVTFLLIERFHLTRLVRFIPFQVTAGFLASTGWLMASGALNIIAGTPLTLDGLNALVQQPWRPELVAGFAFAGALALLQRRMSAAIAIPVYVVLATLLVNVVVRWFCAGPMCEPSIWFFAAFDKLHWFPPWRLHLDASMLTLLPQLVPSFLALAFIGTLTVLLSLSSLELTYGRDFRLEEALRLHGRHTFITTLLGGYVGAISIGRSAMCRSTGGGPWTGFIIAAVCLGVLFGMGGLLAYVPKAALGALVLSIGIGMLRQWVWDLRRTLRQSEWLQVVGILLCVVAFGYVVGFLAGLLAACIFFVVNYSRMPFIALDTTLAAARSSVIRNTGEQAWLTRAGEQCRIGRFEGFVFFGVASAIYDWYRAGDPAKQPVCLLDFSRARGIDPSAVAVLEKIIRNQNARGQRLLVVLSRSMQKRLAIRSTSLVEVLHDFDSALERAEDLLLAQAQRSGEVGALNAWLGPQASAEQLEKFGEYLVPVALDAGQTLFGEGEMGDDLYFVEDGSLEILKTAIDGHAMRLCKVRAGAFVGEMAMYTGQPRSASAVAAERASLLMLTHAARVRLQEQEPDLARLLDHQVVLGLANNVARANSLLRLQTA